MAATLKTSNEDLTLDADGSGSDIIFQSNGSNVATLDQAGLLTATTFSGSAASLTSIPAANITGTLPAIDGSSLTGIAGGITEADQWQLNVAMAFSATTHTFATANWLRVTGTGYGTLGTGMSESSGVFTFPSTGYWLITWEARLGGTVDNRYFYSDIWTTTDNNTYTEAIRDSASIKTTSDSGYTTYASTSSSFLFDVTSTTNCKVKFGGYSRKASTEIFNDSFATFLKLGDT
jgi:hypothetical protein